MKTKLKEISGNDLSELQVMTYRMAEQIETFSHVSDMMPAKLKRELEAYREQLQTERERREDEWQ